MTFRGLRLVGVAAALAAIVAVSLPADAQAASKKQLEQQINQLANEVDDLQEQIEELEEALANIGDTSALEAQIAALQAQLQAQAEANANLQAQVQANANAIAQIEELLFQCGVLNPNNKECLGNCVDTANDLNNCGNCGIVCPGDRVCQNGACVALVCPAPTTQVNGAPLGIGCTVIVAEEHQCVEQINLAANGQGCFARNPQTGGVNACTQGTCDFGVCTGFADNCGPGETCKPAGADQTCQL